MLPEKIKNSCEKTLGCPIKRVSAVSGGDINQARLLHTLQGVFFLKYNTSDHAPDMLEVERKGLELIAASNCIRVPAIIGFDATKGGAYLLLEYIPSGKADTAFWISFGSALAQMHRSRQDHFGLNHDNYIGRLPQRNAPQKSAVDFLIEDRLEPQCRMAIDRQLLSSADLKEVKGLFQKLPRLIPEELPSLIHGDLWSGNFMVDENNRAVLIDPAVSYGLREMDLAMSRLFGGFDALFYRAYQEAYPLHDDWEQRMDIYQLYYLLVHLNMFGRSYLGSVQQILRKYQ
jgi:protein-ribulosamine 3-kinase